MLLLLLLLLLMLMLMLLLFVLWKVPKSTGVKGVFNGMVLGFVCFGEFTLEIVENRVRETWRKQVILLYNLDIIFPFRILHLFAEENAVEDTIYYLSEALRKEAINVDVFLKVRVACLCFCFSLSSYLLTSHILNQVFKSITFGVSTNFLKISLY